MSRPTTYLLLAGLAALMLAWSPARPAAAVPDDRLAPAVNPVGPESSERPAAAAASGPADQAASRPRPMLPPLEPVYGEPTYMVLPGGTVVEPRSFYSPILDQSMRYEVILPPGYRAGLGGYPVVYLLHGYDGWSHSWIELGLHQTADYLWAEGGLEPFVIVLPDAGNSYYLNHADNGPRWADYLLADLVGEVDAEYRTLPSARHRAIGGLSMGGDGALQLALNHPDVFGIVGAHSPTTRLSYDLAPGAFFGDEDYWQRHNPVWLIEHTDSARQLTIWIDTGDADRWAGSARAIHAALLDQDIPHRYLEPVGDHEADYWILGSQSYLRFYAEAFGATALARASEEQPS